jgi:hypothetical protein
VFQVGLPGNVTIAAFEETTSNVKTAADIQYSIQTQAKFITFDPATMLLSWQTSTVGNFTVTI